MQFTNIFVQPFLPTTDLDRTVEFYQALGFEVVQHTTIPYQFAEVRCGELWLHFSGLAPYGGKKSFSACTIMIEDVPEWHEHFAAGLRKAFGSVPVSGLPRITRPRSNQNRFATFDPNGNMLVFLDKSLPGPVYYDAGSELAQVRMQAEFLRDIYANDAASATMLDRAIADADQTERLELGRILALRAEIAVAANDGDKTSMSLKQLEDLALSEIERAEIADELSAARHLERWVGNQPDHVR